MLRSGFGGGKEWPSGGAGEVGLGKLHFVEAKTRAGLPSWGVGAADWVAVGPWRAAINKELGDMDDKKVWEIINKEDVPEGRKCKWIFKIKRNGIF
jgi:hypothetical protein